MLTVTVVVDESLVEKCPQNPKRRGNISVESKLTIFGAADERLYCFAVDIAGQRRARWDKTVCIDRAIFAFAIVGSRSGLLTRLGIA
jgi:hypothetical protein